jgi:hypothetical protein
MSLDTLARRAGADVRRAATQMEPALPDAYDVVRRGDRRRTNVLVALCVLSLVLAGAAFVRSGDGDGTQLATAPPITAADPTVDPVGVGPSGQVAGQVLLFDCAPGEDCGPAPVDVAVILYQPALGAAPSTGDSGAPPGDPAAGSEGTSEIVSMVADDDGRFAAEVPVGQWQVFVVDLEPLDCGPASVTIREHRSTRLDLRCRSAAGS